MELREEVESAGRDEAALRALHARNAESLRAALGALTASLRTGADGEAIAAAERLVYYRRIDQEIRERLPSAI